jgi:hypothetical protein
VGGGQTGNADADLDALVAAVREGRWLKSPREAKAALVFVVLGDSA